MDGIAIRRALISVTDKTGVVEFAKGLEGLKVRLLSTGGTARLLRENGVELTEVSRHTGFPEMLDGRVKTLHPKIHGGILGLRDNPEHLRTMEEHGIEPIDMVVVNLYAFEKTVGRPGCTLEDAVENIDIGGPTLVRAAAKNFRHVAVVTDPSDYRRILDELNRSGGRLDPSTCFELAGKAFCLTHEYDGAICGYLKEKSKA